MIKLHGRLGKRVDAEPFVARVARPGADRPADRDREALFVNGPGPVEPGYRAYLVADGPASGPIPAGSHAWPIPGPLQHLSDGDIIRISPRSGELWVMYRRGAASNSMLLTERCNSYCLMCSQPPKAGIDDH